jgi:hypothetical protein
MPPGRGARCGRYMARRRASHESEPASKAGQIQGLTCEVGLRSPERARDRESNPRFSV